MNRRVICIFLAMVWTWGAAVADALPEPVHYPQLIRAEVPLYPPLARTAHVTGDVQILITIEDGLVTQAEIKSTDAHVSDPSHRASYDAQARAVAGRRLSEPSVANVKTWQFEPGSHAQIVVTYVYRIEGSVTASPESPQVQLDLPNSVRIVARPFRTTQD